MTSTIFAEAANQYRICRAQYSDYLEDVFRRASDECSGVLLNARGTLAQIDPFTLFSGSDTRALAYASEELIDWWRVHPRLTYTSYESQWYQPWTGDIE